MPLEDPQQTRANQKERRRFAQDGADDFYGPVPVTRRSRTNDCRAYVHETGPAIVARFRNDDDTAGWESVCCTLGNA